MNDQLIKKDCTTGEYGNIFPVTTLNNVIDPDTRESLDILLEKNNHVYLPFIENLRSATRLQIEDRYRRKGLYITYTSCKGEVITEYYNCDDFSDEAWACGNNWVRAYDEIKAKQLLKSIYSWYKA